MLLVVQSTLMMAMEWIWMQLDSFIQALELMRIWGKRGYKMWEIQVEGGFMQ